MSFEGPSGLEKTPASPRHMGRDREKISDYMAYHTSHHKHYMVEELCHK